MTKARRPNKPLQIEDIPWSSGRAGLPAEEIWAGEVEGFSEPITFEEYLALGY